MTCADIDYTVYSKWADIKANWPRMTNAALTMSVSRYCQYSGRDLYEVYRWLRRLGWHSSYSPLGVPSTAHATATTNPFPVGSPTYVLYAQYQEAARSLECAQEKVAKERAQELDAKVRVTAFRAALKKLTGKVPPAPFKKAKGS